MSIAVDKAVKSTLSIVFTLPLLKRKGTSMKRAVAAMCIVSVLGLWSAPAQEKDHTNPPFMKRPEPGPERARLSFLVGKFVTETYILPSPRMKEGAKGAGTSIIEWSLDSMFLSVNEQSTNAILGNYQGHGMLGYDPQEKKYVLSMFNNFGDHPKYEGNFAGDTLVLATRVPLPGRAFDQRLQWFHEGRKVRLQILNDLGQGFKLVIDQTATHSSTATKK